MPVNLWICFWRNWFWPVLALCLLYLAMMVWPGGKWASIEQDVSGITQQVLADEGFGDITLSTENRGRDVLLSGVVQSEEERNRLISLAESSVDQGDRVAPRVVKWVGTIEEPEPVVLSNGELRLGVDANSVILSGVLASQQEVDDVFATAKNTYYDRTINNQLTVGENIKPIGDIAAFFKGFNTLEGALFVKGSDITLNGQVDRAELKQSIGDQVLAAVGANYTIDNQIDVVEPVVIEPKPELVIQEENKICQQKLQDLMESTNIYFATNRADIKSSSLKTLNDIRDVLSQCPDASIEVAGHTDSAGKDDLNLSLSQRRAETVVDFLTSTEQLKNEITAVGYGETTPVADNSTALGRAKNRRIQFIVK